MTVMGETFQERLDSIRGRMDAACEKAGRDPSEVHLLPVSKTMPPEKIREASECGITLLGENKVQEAAAKIPECPGHITWHMIGHLQRNKVKLAVQLFDMIHSVDSLRLLETVDRAAHEAGKVMPCLIEVNVAGESAKFGATEDELADILEASTKLMNVEIRGLMTMPPYFDDPEQVRPFFLQLRELRDRSAERTGIPLEELSMGMTHDFEIAIEEGSTWIRIGTALFGERTKK